MDLPIARTLTETELRERRQTILTKVPQYFTDPISIPHKSAWRKRVGIVSHTDFGGDLLAPFYQRRFSVSILNSRQRRPPVWDTRNQLLENEN
jgi:hypothetical protein